MIATAQRDVIALLGGETFPKMESVSLRLQKFVRLGDNSKKDEIASVVDCHARYRQPIRTIRPVGACVFRARLGGRLIVNQAGGILENAGLCLHRHFGDPYLPGSAVKGLARHAAWCQWSDAEDADKGSIAERIAHIFGNPTGDKGLDAFIKGRCPGIPQTLGGGVAFLAAVPEGGVALATDIVNGHHPKYYAGKQPDAIDNESPNPQFFPVVEGGIEFNFTLVPLRRLGTDTGGLMVQAKAWLIAALSVDGAGAKTAAGYGWFEYDVDKEAREEQAERERLEAARLKAQQEAAEQARLSSLGPVERARDHILKLGSEPFAHFAKNLASKTEDEQRAFVRLLRHPDKKDWWKTKKKKDAPLADAIRAAAVLLKEELT